ncbi:MAG TPA: acetolactate synthase small subunit, partial [Spirochaetales bacterium]|nr:acetolactate synthase small subunit [Spirochaetales bacterium]
MKHTISILCKDTPGVLNRISSLFSRRGFNIESLSVGHTDLLSISRFTIVVQGDDRVLEQVRKQLQKLVHVIKVWDIKPEDGVEREHALVKIKVDEAKRAELLQIITAVQAR